MEMLSWAAAFYKVFVRWCRFNCYVALTLSPYRSHYPSSSVRSFFHPPYLFPIVFLQFEAAAYVLTKEEGGRHKPFFSKYRPQFYFRTADVTGEVILAEDGAMVMPGDDATLQVELIHPVPMEPGLRFAMREGGRTIGSGVVSSITE